MKIRKPISKAVFSSEVMNEATSTPNGISSGEAKPCVYPERLAKVSRSVSRICASMKARKGSEVAVHAASKGSVPSR